MHTKSYINPIILLVSLLLTFTSYASESANKLGRLDDIVKNYLKDSKIPGLSIKVTVASDTFERAYGLASIQQKLPTTLNSSYKIASVTKPMTAVAVLQLVEKGLVRLDDEIQKHVPHFPMKGFPVTVGQLLSHTGGISHYKSDSEKHFKTYKTTREAISLFKDWKLVSTPGTEFNYSTYGYNLLGALIENVSGISYEAYLSENIWKVSGMLDTEMDRFDSQKSNYVEEYSESWWRGVKKAERIDVSSRFAGGGVRSTVLDLTLFAQSLVNGKLLNTDTMNLMIEPNIIMKGEQFYAMGWNTYPTEGGNIIFHSGAMPQTSAHLMISPDDNITIAIACNLGRQVLQYLAFDILEELRKMGSE